MTSGSHSRPADDAAASDGDRPLGLRFTALWSVGFFFFSLLVTGSFGTLADLLRISSEDLIIATYTMQADTESLSFEPVASDARDAASSLEATSWVVPPGTFTYVPDGDTGCALESASDEGFCQLVSVEETLLTVLGAKVRLDTTARGLTITVTPSGQGEFSAELRDSQDIVALTRGLLSFESRDRNMTMRLPLILSQATVGAPLYENVSVSADGADTAQPMLLAGSYAVVAGIGSSEGRDSYAVTQGSLGPGDVLTMERSCLGLAAGKAAGDRRPTEQEGAILGVASVEAPEGSPRAVIRVNLNACVPVGGESPRIGLRRFGSTAPTTVHVPSRWVVIGGWPQWSSFWLTLGGLLGLFAALLTIAGTSLPRWRRGDVAGTPAEAAPLATAAQEPPPMQNSPAEQKQ